MQQGTEEHAMQGTRKSKFLFLIKFNQVREVNFPAKIQQNVNCLPSNDKKYDITQIQKKH